MNDSSYSYFNNSALTNLYDYIMRTIKVAASQSHMLKVTNNFRNRASIVNVSKLLFNKNSTEAKKRVKHSLKLYINDRVVNNLEHYLASKKTYRNLIKIVKKSLSNKLQTVYETLRIAWNF